MGWTAQDNRQYSGEPLTESSAKADPVEMFAHWMAQAERTNPGPSYLPNAVSLATADASGQPDVRMVLLKHFDARGFVFFSHSTSAKGRQLAENPRAAMVVYWPQLDRQVRISGMVEQVDREMAEQYFHSRPAPSQWATRASAQSQPADSRAAIEQAFERVKSEWGDSVPPPDSWVGYRLQPARFEFWQGRPDRLHDRLVYSPDGQGAWSIQRLWP